MFAALTRTAPVHTRTAPRRRTGLAGWIVRWNAAYRERQAIARLDQDRLADMGLSRHAAERITVAEIMARR